MRSPLIPAGRSASSIAATASRACTAAVAAPSRTCSAINAATGVFQNGKPHPFEVGTLYRLTFTRVDKDYDCSTVQASGTTVQATAAFDNIAGPNIGFRTRTASASFPWIMVVKSP